MCKLPDAKARLFHRLSIKGLQWLFIFHATGNCLNKLLATTQIKRWDTSLRHHKGKPFFRVVREDTN